jgi:hypothetical protein
MVTVKQSFGCVSLCSARASEVASASSSAAHESGFIADGMTVTSIA